MGGSFFSSTGLPNGSGGVFVFFSSTGLPNGSGGVFGFCFSSSPNGSGGVFGFFFSVVRPQRRPASRGLVRPETILGKGVRHLRHLRHPLNVEQKCLRRVSDLSQQ